MEEWNLPLQTFLMQVSGKTLERDAPMYTVNIVYVGRKLLSSTSCPPTKAVCVSLCGVCVCLSLSIWMWLLVMMTMGVRGMWRLRACRPPCQAWPNITMFLSIFSFVPCLSSPSEASLIVSSVYRKSPDCQTVCVCVSVHLGFSFVFPHTNVLVQWLHVTWMDVDKMPVWQS